MFQFSSPVALVRGARATFVQFRIADGAVVLRSNHEIVVPVLPDDDFTSQGNVLNAASRRGSALLTGSTMSVAALTLHGNRFYGPLGVIENGAVFADMPENEKATLKSKVEIFYSFE